MPVTWNTVKTLFTGNDIAIMRAREVYLDRYVFVAENFDTLLSYIQQELMPPPPFPSWTTEMIDTFKQWKTDGFLKEDPSPSDTTTDFIALSVFLTGVDNLDNDSELAAKYFDRLWTATDGIPNPEPTGPYTLPQATVQSALQSLLNDPTAGNLVTDDNRRVAKATILLWYTGAFISRYGFPDGDNGTPEDNQYPEGLAWRVSQAHPQGYSTVGAQLTDGIYESTHYWSEQPLSAQNTGLGTQEV